jgi:Cof subfamily protein (haloacid dehalogenase superfamily)
MRTLYLSDLDGTLLNDSARLGSETIALLNRLIQTGVLFTCATARSYTSASVVTAGLELRLPMATFNGTFFVSPKDGGVLKSYRIEKTDLENLIGGISRIAALPLVYSMIDGRERVSWLQGQETAGIRHYLESRRGDARLRPVEHFHEIYQGDVFYSAIIGSKADLPLFRQMAASQPKLSCNLQQDTYDRSEYWLEVYHKNASKRNAAHWLKEYVKADRVVCFGDNRNDIPMFEASDYAVAVSNACDELKAVADEVIGPNNTDSVARWLADHAR